MADQLSVAKSELLDKDVKNASVRMTLAEAHVISETKEYFKEVKNIIVLSVTC